MQLRPLPLPQGQKEFLNQNEKAQRVALSSPGVGGRGQDSVMLH